ncbi:MAG: transposase [Oligoflexia bacterium]|nr:transposase [Oligoflexia bacterium]
MQEFKGNRFMKRLRASVLRKYKGELDPENFCLAIDDTDNVKSGKNIFRTGKWKSSKGICFGQKVIIIALVDIRNGFAIPLGYRFATKKNEADYLSDLDLAADLVLEAREHGIPTTLPVVADSWFSAAEFIKKINDHVFEIVVELRSNRNAHSNKKELWDTIGNFFIHLKRYSVVARLNPNNKKYLTKRKWFSSISLYIKKLPTLLNVIAVYNGKNSTTPFAFYATTNLSMSGAELWKYSRARWKIECMFRDLKQNLSWGKLECRGEEGSDLTVCIPFIIYTYLLLDFRGECELLCRDSIGLMVKKIRHENMNKTINFFLEDKNVNTKKLLKLKARSKCMVSKPVDTIAEKKSHSDMLAA